MILDTDSTYEIAGVFVAPANGVELGMIYVIAIDGTGSMNTGMAGAQWVPFDALPMTETTELNEGTGEYETTRELTVAIADVVEWTPWTVYTSDGDWYFRSNTTAPWQLASTGGADTEPPVKPDEFVDPQT